MRDCLECGHELEPFFDSTCEPPVAWLCQRCGTVRLEFVTDAVSRQMNYAEGAERLFFQSLFGRPNAVQRHAVRAESLGRFRYLFAPKLQGLQTGSPKIRNAAVRRCRFNF